MVVDGTVITIIASVIAYGIREGINHYKVNQLKETINGLQSKDEAHDKIITSFSEDHIKIKEALNRSFLDRKEGDERYVGKIEFERTIANLDKQMLQLNKTLDTKMDILITAVKNAYKDEK